MNYENKKNLISLKLMFFKLFFDADDMITYDP